MPDSRLIWYFRFAVAVGSGLLVVGGALDHSWQPIAMGLAVLIPYVALWLKSRGGRVK